VLSKFGIKFANKSIKKYWEEAVTPKITNNWYEGQITNGKADRLRVKTITESQGLQTYTPGTALTLGSLTDVNADLLPNQRKGFYFEIDDVNKFESYVDDEKENILDQKYHELIEAIDKYVLGLYGDVAAGNRVGVDTTGSATVAATTGVITSTITFTTAMIGRGVRFGGTAWFRIVSHDGTTGTAVDDKDDVTAAYTGGVFDGVVQPSIDLEASSAVQVTSSNIYAKICDLKEKLDAAKAPRTNRWLVVNSAIANLLVQSTQLIPAVAVAYEEVVRNGRIGRVAGFDVFQSEQIEGTGNTSSDGYHILAGHISWCTFATAFVASTIEEDLTGEFGKAYKGLTCYGAKIIDERRKMGAELYCYV